MSAGSIFDLGSCHPVVRNRSRGIDSAKCGYGRSTAAARRLAHDHGSSIGWDFNYQL
jgi:hypothetical protein